LNFEISWGLLNAMLKADKFYLTGEGTQMARNNLGITRIFCVGMNYIEHIREMGNPIPETPVIFMKPATSAVGPGEQIHFPKHGKALHHEVEFIAKIGREGKAKNEEEALSFIESFTIGVDLTLRDLQAEIKKKGRPWEIAKAFDQSALLGNFVPYDRSVDLNNISFSCKVNGTQKQTGNTGGMVFNVTRLLVVLSTVWELYPGDILYTGTPSGVGPLNIGDTIEIYSDKIGTFSWKIIE
jgi:acylpyruvate hydrolase